MTDLRDEILDESPRITGAELRRFGSRIVQRRNARGWKQRELARRTGIEPSRLSRLERGLGMPRIEELARLRAVLSWSVDELLFGAEPAEPEAIRQVKTELEDKGYTEEAATLSRLVRLLLGRCGGEARP